MADRKRETASSRRAIVFPEPRHGVSIQSLEAFATRGQESLSNPDTRADARLEARRLIHFRLAGNGYLSAHDVKAESLGEFGCGLRVGNRQGVGFAVGEGAFSWSELLSAAQEHARGTSRIASTLPPYAEDELRGPKDHISPTEVTTPTRSWFADVHEELRGPRKKLVLGELELWCTIGWRVVLRSGGACWLRDAHDLRLSAVGTVSSPWGHRWPISVSVGSTYDWPGIGVALLDAASGLDELLRFSQRDEMRDYAGPVVLNPQVAGFLVHEAIGHLSEADRLSPDVRKQIVAGGRVRVGPDELNVTDHAEELLARGAIPFDDEGVRCIAAPLVRSGYWEGLLHSRQTAAADSAVCTGNARTTSFRHVPLCRMRTTEIHRGNTSREDILLNSGDALFLGCAQEGEVPGGNVRIRAWAWRIRDGEVRDCLGPVTLSGEAPAMLREINAIGTDLRVIDGHPGCGRRGQPGLLPVSMIAPTVRLRHAIVRFG